MTVTIGNPLLWLGGKIDIKVELATNIDPEGGGLWDVAEWDNNVWSSTQLAYQDITQYMLRCNIRRGQQRWDSRYEAGVATFIFDNTTGLFSQGAGETPWSATFRPGRMIRVVIIPFPDMPEFTVTRFTGRIDSSEDIYTEGASNIVTKIIAIDALGDLHDHNPPAMASATGIQFTDSRVTTVLDNMGWPAWQRHIQPGEHTIQTSYLAQTSLEECQRAADAEGGVLYADGDNKIVFRNRDWLLDDVAVFYSSDDSDGVDFFAGRSTTIQGYIGYEPEELSSDEEGAPTAQIVNDIHTPWELQRVRNDVQFAANGGSLQQVEDTDSQILYGVKSYSRRDFHNQYDAEVLTLAERNLAAYKDARPRLQPLTIVANDDPANEDLNRLFWDVEFGDLHAIKIETTQGWFTEYEAHVIGIEDEITGEEWSVTFTHDDSIIAALESLQTSV